MSIPRERPVKGRDRARTTARRSAPGEGAHAPRESAGSDAGSQTAAAKKGRRDSRGNGEQFKWKKMDRKGLSRWKRGQEDGRDRAPRFWPRVEGPGAARSARRGRSFNMERPGRLGGQERHWEEGPARARVRQGRAPSRGHDSGCQGRTSHSFGRRWNPPGVDATIHLGKRPNIQQNRLGPHLGQRRKERGHPRVEARGRFFVGRVRTSVGRSPG